MPNFALTYLDVSLSQVLAALTSEFAPADIVRALAHDYRGVGLEYAVRVADELDKTAKVIDCIDDDEAAALASSTQ